MAVHVYRVVHYHPYTSLHALYAPNKTDRREAVTWPLVRGLQVRDLGSEAPVGYEVPFTERPRASGLLLLCSTPSLVTNHSPPALRRGTRRGKCRPLPGRRQPGVALLMSGSRAPRMNFGEVQAKFRESPFYALR